MDNGSDDGVLEAVSGRWPTVETFQTGDNLGFAGGMNRGIEWALARGAATVTVLNNDTLVPPGVAAALAARARSGVAVSPEVRYAANGAVWFGGGVVDGETGLARHLTDAEMARAFPGSGPRSVETLAGCCVTASAEVWRTVGGFDERYFLIFEDADWSMRARARGVDLRRRPVRPDPARGLGVLHRGPGAARALLLRPQRSAVRPAGGGRHPDAVNPHGRSGSCGDMSLPR